MYVIRTIRAQNYAIICLLATFVPIFYSSFYPLSLFCTPLTQHHGTFTLKYVIMNSPKYIAFFLEQKRKKRAFRLPSFPEKDI